MIHTKLNQRGFTLAETLLVLGASALIGTILVTIMVQGSGAIFSQNIQISQNISLNNASSKITETIKYASSIEDTYTNGANSYTTNDSTIIVQLSAIDSQGAIIDDKFDTFIITRDPIKTKILKKYTFADPSSSRKSTSQVILTDLSDIKFIYLGSNDLPVTPTSANRVDFIVKTAEKSGYGMKESSISGRINLKNS